MRQAERDDEGRAGGVRDKKTGRFGIAFQIHSDGTAIIRWSDDYTERRPLRGLEWYGWLE